MHWMKIFLNILFAFCKLVSCSNSAVGYRNAAYDIVNVDKYLIFETVTVLLSKCLLLCHSFGDCFGIRYNHLSQRCQIVSLDSSEIFQGVLFGFQPDQDMYYQVVKGKMTSIYSQ